MKVVTEILHMFYEVFWFIGLSAIQWIVGRKEKSVTRNICLITGSAGGTGRYFALEFAKKGAILVLWDTNEKGNESTAKKARDLGAKVYTYTCDVSHKETVYETAERVKQEVGDVTILINNAAIRTQTSFLQCEDELLERILQTNSHAHFWTVKAFLPRMMEMNHGHIITVTSNLGLVATAYMEGYCTSQFAAVGFHESLSHELKARRITDVKTTLICFCLVTGFPLRKEYFVRQAMKGILTDQHVIYTPRLLYITAFLKHVLPWDAQIHCSKRLDIKV
ncbi:retinol dehydrogenase 10-like [Bombina bombina]|uniref:retinol dehydrogenase 10-like n=1 Tax=Bombina bombina TaxID=8345 RepID=UPI00235ADE08|nr:retinol dehydrogenase 10-like [Bombina bombina]